MNQRHKSVENRIKAIKLPCEIRSIRKVSKEILNDLSEYSVGEDTLFDIRLCVEEAVRNAIVHGNRMREGSHIGVRYWVDAGKFNIEIEDEGPGFDPACVADPTENGNIMKGSGRGVYLIMRLMDKVVFNEKGNRIKMEKALK